MSSCARRLAGPEGRYLHVRRGVSVLRTLGPFSRNRGNRSITTFGYYLSGPAGPIPPRRWGSAVKSRVKVERSKKAGFLRGLRANILPVTSRGIDFSNVGSRISDVGFFGSAFLKRLAQILLPKSYLLRSVSQCLPW